MIVAFEGVDGSGKSSTLKELAMMVSETLNGASKFYFVREPHNDQYIDLIRSASSVEERALLFAADRHRLYTEIGGIVSHQEITVFTDRSYISNYAYQYYDFVSKNNFKDTLESLEFLKWMRTLQPSNCTIDVVVFFEARPEVCVQRCTARKEPLVETKVIVLNHIYRTIIRNLKCKCINVSTDNGLTTREICRSILNEVSTLEDC